MKNLLITLVALLCFMTNINAQEKDPWVGTWTSESFETVRVLKETRSHKHTTSKHVIKITKTENGYYVRKKTIDLEDSNHTFYENVTSADVEGNTMWIQTSYSTPFPNPADKKEIRTRNYMKLELQGGGVIKYSYYYQLYQEYDTDRGIVIKECEYNIDQSNTMNCCNLFNDDW